MKNFRVIEERIELKREERELCLFIMPKQNKKGKPCDMGTGVTISHWVSRPCTACTAAGLVRCTGVVRGFGPIVMPIDAVL